MIVLDVESERKHQDQMNPCKASLISLDSVIWESIGCDPSIVFVVGI